MVGFTYGIGFLYTLILPFLPLSDERTESLSPTVRELRSQLLFSPWQA